MSHSTIQIKVRPSVPPGDPPGPPIPLVRLRDYERRRLGYHRPVIMPEDCKVRDCPICAWRIDGIIPMEL